MYHVVDTCICTRHDYISAHIRMLHAVYLAFGFSLMFHQASLPVGLDDVKLRHLEAPQVLLLFQNEQLT